MEARLTGVVVAFVALLFSFSTQATLLGRLPNITFGVTGYPAYSDYQAYYDTDSNLTWLTNANAAVYSGYDYYRPGTGLMNWFDANDWALTLNIHGVTGWRLPNTVYPDAGCVRGSVASAMGTNCTGSEMGNLYYNTLGGNSIDPLPSVHNPNYDLFSNIESGGYWSTTLLDPGAPFSPGAAYYFHMGNGEQLEQYISFHLHAWAVHSGDIGGPGPSLPSNTVPEPATLPLIGVGFIGIAGLARSLKRVRA